MTETLPIRLRVVHAPTAVRPESQGGDGAAAQRGAPHAHAGHGMARASFSSFQPRRLSFVDAIGELFILRVEGHIDNPDVELDALAGAPVEVELAEQALVPLISGIVVEAAQKAAVAVGASTFEFVVGPAMWLTTLRRDCRIFQAMSVPDIVAAVVAGADYAGRVPPPALRLSVVPAPREYCVQYDETDWEFVCRILADEGIAFVFDQAAGGLFTLIDDTSVAPLETGVTIPFRDLSNMAPLAREAGAAPHLTRVGAIRSPRAAMASLRDYDFLKPSYPLEGGALAASAPFAHEPLISVFGIGVGKFADAAAGEARASARLDAQRVGRRRVTCEGSFLAQIGAALTLDGCPRADLNGEVVVTAARVELEAGARSRFAFEATPRAERHRPPPRPKARIFGTQTAVVVGPPGEEIAVDPFGRVQVEFRWDRRDTHTENASRWVRVAQPCAGGGFGVAVTPRVGDEVVVSFLDGDPDQPLVVGRVHNATRVSPLSLPDEKTQSVWRSQSTPGGGGFNEIRMEDAAGAEVLSITAQRDRVEKVGRHVQRNVVGNESAQVGGDAGADVTGNQSVNVGGDQSVGVGGSYSINAGASFSVHAPKVAITGDALVHVTTGAERLDESALHLLRTGMLIVQASGVTMVASPVIELIGTTIVLKAGASSILMSDSGIVINGPVVDVHGKPIKLNC